MSDVYDYPFGFRGLVLNEHRTSAGLYDETKEDETIRVTLFDFSRLQQRDQREPLHLLTGGDLGDATLAFRYLSISGVVKSRTGAGLADKVSAIEQAFDVEEAQRDSVATEGLSDFTFTDTTLLSSIPGSVALAAPEVGFYVPEKYIARPAAFPVITGRRSGGNAATWATELVCEDPRRYLQTATTITLNGGNGFSQTCPNWNTTLGKAVFPLITITTSANGSATFTLTMGGKVLVLNLSGVGAASITIDTATGIIKKGGVHAADLRVSAVDSYPSVPRGGTTAVATNTTNVTSVVIAYSQARG